MGGGYTASSFEKTRVLGLVKTGIDNRKFHTRKLIEITDMIRIINLVELFVPLYEDFPVDEFQLFASFLATADNKNISWFYVILFYDTHRNCKVQ